MTNMVMTNLVISQASRLEIAQRAKTVQNLRMPSLPKALPAETRQAMSPDQIGRRLRLLRESQKLSPAEMADTLGIERTYWSRFENGRRAITDAVAALLVVRFGVTLDFIILGKWDKLPFDLAEAMRSVDRAPPK